MMSWFPVNISNFIYAIQSGFFGGLQNDANVLGDSSTAPPSVTTTTPNIDQSKSSTSVVHLVTTCVLYLNTIINPMIYAMSASSMRNRILTSIRPRPGIHGPFWSVRRDIPTGTGRSVDPWPRQNSSLGSISEKTKELSKGSSDLEQPSAQTTGSYTKIGQSGDSW